MSEYIIKVDDVINNIRIVKGIAKTELIGVIKGNGYGFGMHFMAGLLKSEGISTFAVTEVTDLKLLRKDVLPDEDILIMRSTCIADEAKVIAEYDGTATVGSLESGRILNRIAKEMGKTVKAHLKIDTGMCRYGFTPAQIEQAIQTYRECDCISFTGIYTHFSSAFTNEKLTKAQIMNFNRCVEQIRQAGINPGKVHAANSPALLNVDDVSFDAVRIGSAFTGRVITKNKATLKRAGYLRSRIVEIKDVPKGTPIGYNGGYTTKRDSRIAIVPVGHFDGFGVEKAADTNGFGVLIHTILSAGKRFLKKDRIAVSIHGKRAYVTGHIGLSHTAVDVTGTDAKPGDEVRIDLSPLFVNPQIKRIYE